MYYNAVAAAAVPLFPSALQSSIAKGDYAPKSSLTCQVYMATFSVVVVSLFENAGLLDESMCKACL